MLQPSNSPDLNMIELCQLQIKRETTKKGAPTSRAAAEQIWLETWKKLEQWRIQAWIERITRHIKKVIKLQRGNDQCEGAEENQRFRKELCQAA